MALIILYYLLASRFFLLFISGISLVPIIFGYYIEPVLKALSLFPKNQNAVPMAKTSKKPEVTTAHMATLAAKTLLNPDATVLEKKLAGALLTQAPDKSKNKTRK